MKNRCLTLFCIVCFGLTIAAQEKDKNQGIDVRVEALKSKDLKRTAHRFRIGVDQLVNARTALKEATDLALRQDAPTNEYGMLGSLWVQLDRRRAREEIANLIAMVSRQAQTAADLASYRQSTTVGFQLIGTLSQVDPEGAKKIGELWPEPAASFGEAGGQALMQMRTDLSRRTSMNNTNASQNYEEYLDPQKSASLPFLPRIMLASSLMSSNQKDKARALLDRAVQDLGKVTPEPGKMGEYQSFIRGLVSMYPERVLDAVGAYRDVLSRDNSNPGTIYEIGDQRVTLTPVESMTVSMLRGLTGQPELALKLVDANPGLKSKLNQLGGVDRVLSPSQLSSAPLRTYSANSQPPPPVNNANAMVLSGGAQADPQNNTPVVNATELFKTLYGHAEFNPEWVRRKLADACTTKEHFTSLVSLAQMALSQDPDLSTVALEVARGLLVAFDTPQSQSSSIRTLITTSRQVDGEVDPGLLRQGFNLVQNLREEEKKQEQSVSLTIHPSDDLEIMLIAQTALEDFPEALRRARSLERENVRIRALFQIAQTLMSYY